jgi:hypothetical protein
MWMPLSITSPFDLVEHRRVRGVAVLTEDAARRDDADRRRLLRHHGADLHRRGVRAQQHRAARRRVREIEGVVHRARRMAFGDVERGEVVPVVLDLGTGRRRRSPCRRRFRPARPSPGSPDGRAARRFGRGQRQVDRSARAALRARRLRARPCARRAPLVTASRRPWICGPWTCRSSGDIAPSVLSRPRRCPACPAHQCGPLQALRAWTLPLWRLRLFALSFPNSRFPQRFCCGRWRRPTRRFHQLDHSSDFCRRWCIANPVPNLVEHLVESYNLDWIAFQRSDKILMLLPKRLFSPFDVRDSGPIRELARSSDLLNLIDKGLGPFLSTKLTIAFPCRPFGVFAGFGDTFNVTDQINASLPRFAGNDDNSILSFFRGVNSNDVNVAMNAVLLRFILAVITRWTKLDVVGRKITRMHETLVDDLF